MKSNVRQYQIVSTNDRSVIFYASARRALLEALGDRAQTQTDLFNRESIQNLVGFLQCAVGVYLHTLPNKIRRALMDTLRAERSINGFPAVIQRAHRLGVDHVGFSRMGIGSACALLFEALFDLANQADDDAEIDPDPGAQKASGVASAEPRSMDPGNPESGSPSGENTPGISIMEVHGLIAQHLRGVEKMLEAAARRACAEMGHPTEGVSIEVIAHDLTAPLLVICPDLRAPLIGQTEYDRQIPEMTFEHLHESFARLAESAADEVIERRQGETSPLLE